MKDYKIEIKPTFWEVSIETGCYSDWSIEHLYFRGNNELEVWFFLCRYAEDNYNNQWDDIRALVWEDKKYVVKKWLNDKSRFTYNNEVNFETDYGDAKLVKINRIKVIEFQK